jgi:hypothetical protein
MAHPCDYASQSDIHALKKSSQPKIQPQNPYEIVNNFLSNHPHWSLDSIVRYCLITFKSDGVDRDVVSQCIKYYIDSGK